MTKHDDADATARRNDRSLDDRGADLRQPRIQRHGASASRIHSLAEFLEAAQAVGMSADDVELVMESHDLPRAANAALRAWYKRRHTNLPQRRNGTDDVAAVHQYMVR